MLFYVAIPLMVIGVLVATLPVLIGSVHNERRIRAGHEDTGESAAREADRLKRRFRGRQSWRPGG